MRKDWRATMLILKMHDRHRIWVDICLGKGTGEEVARKGKYQI